MNNYNSDQIRNISFLGNSSSGKTTLIESILFSKGIINRKGEVENKNTVSDYNEIEQENGNSIFSSVMYAEHNNSKINMIDTPGLDDFVGNIISSLHVTDAGIMLVNAQNGVEVGTDIQSRLLTQRNKAMAIVINQLDHEKANYDTSVESLKEKFGGKIGVLQFPVNVGAGFNAVIDVLKMKMFTYKDESGKPEITDIPDEHKSKAEELRTELIEKSAENDEELMEIFFEKEDLTEEEMHRGIKAGVKNRGLFPVLCTSSKKNIGITPLLDFITQALPAPNEMSAAKTVAGKDIPCDPSATTNAFVFKTSLETHIGEVNYLKVISGELTEGMDITNLTTNTKERLSQIFAAQGKNRDKAAKLVAGDIGAAVKLKNTKTNHTLSTDSNAEQIEPIDFPEPKHRSAIKPESEGEEEKLGTALQQMHNQDPTIIIEYSKELKQIIVHGQGEYHLDLLKWHLDNIFKVGSEYIPPKIPYRETITKVAGADYRHKKQSGGAGQFGEVWLVIEPYHEGAPDPTTYKINGKDTKINVRNKEEYDLDWGGKLVFYNCIVGGAIDAKFLPAILKGIMEKMENGPLTGCYARDIRVAVYDGKMHPVDSNEVSFKLAGRNAFQKAFMEAGPKILEPVYDVQIYVPADRMGDVMSDLQGRRSIVQGMNSESGFEIINAKVPLAEMNKYSTTLNSLTNGRATYTMKFSEYNEVPGDVQEKLLKEHQTEEEEA
jgi:elongation factor G